MPITIAKVGCSECSTGTYRATNRIDDYACSECGNLVGAGDIYPNLDANECLSVQHNNTAHPDLVVVTTEACECCGTLNDFHFTVVTADGYVDCPNDPR